MLNNESPTSLPYHKTTTIESCVKLDISYTLKRVIQSEMNCNDKKEKIQNKSSILPPQINAVINVLLRMVPPNIDSLARANNQAVKVQEKVTKWRQLFPVNECAFTIPDDSSSHPDPNYEYISNTTLYFLHWELVNPILIGRLTCPYCNYGKLKRN